MGILKGLVKLQLPIQVEEETPIKKEQSWDEFWPAFNTAVQNGDAAGVVKMSVMPLQGHHHGPLDARHFTEHFNDIFDAKAKEVFANATDQSFMTVKAELEEMAKTMNVEKGTKLKVLTVNYISDKGTAGQSESTTLFNFGKINGQYKLVSMMQAG